MSVSLSALSACTILYLDSSKRLFTMRHCWRHASLCAIVGITQWWHHRMSAFSACSMYSASCAVSLTRADREAVRSVTFVLHLTCSLVLTARLYGLSLDERNQAGMRESNRQSGLLWSPSTCTILIPVGQEERLFSSLLPPCLGHSATHFMTTRSAPSAPGPLPLAL